MRKSVHLISFAALIAVPVTAQAQDTSTCLTDSEARAMLTFAIPEALEGVANKCAAALPPTAFMRNKGAETVAQFRTAAQGSWPVAKSAFLKFGRPGDDTKMMAAMPDSALMPFVSAALSQVVAQDIKPADCPKIDRFVAALAPLPPAHVVELVTALIALVETKGKNDLKLC